MAVCLSSRNSFQGTTSLPAEHAPYHDTPSRPLHSARFIKDGKNESLSTQGTCYYNGTWFEDKEELPTRGLCLVCHCFSGFTEPNAFTCSVIDCPWDDYHRRFPGCTPIYADRDCCPIGWECDYGTQNPGSQQVKSPGCDCEWRYLKHYEAKGCRPVYEEKKHSDGEESSCTCPWRFDCSQADELHADERACIYKKHVYPIGSKITTNNPCETCSCVRDYFTQAATISCSNTECPTVYSQTPLPEGCHYVYKENMCCPTSVECPTAQKDNVYKVPICEYKGKMYYEGEQIYPDEDPCLICLCNQNWTGINSTSCRQHDCMLERDSRKLKQGCIPIYHEKTCCPIDYHCADEDFDFKGNKGPSFKSEDDEDEMCYFESRYYPVGHVLDIKHPTNCVTCTCKTPPDFTCIHSSCPPPPNNDYNNCKAVYKPHSCCPDYTCEEKASTACPDPICKGTNCWLVKQDDGCQVCRCKSRCVPCPPMCQPENPENECSGCICQINSTALLEFEKKDESVENKQESSLKHLVQECKSMNCQSDERCMLVETKCEEEPCLPVPKCEKVSFGCGQKSCPEGCEEIGSYESSCPLCYCKQQIKEPQYKLTCRVQSCEENCILIGRDEEGCPVCKCPQGNLEERACAPSPCRGYNCTMAVNSLGCAECRCQLSCKPKECPVGCDMDLDVPANSGLECGCQCKNSTTAMEHILSKPVSDSCPPVSCQGLNCTYGEDKAGCPICFCKAPCPAPTCQEGCKIEEEVKEPGRCPGCACKLSRSARDNTVKECPPPTCLGYNCSVVTADDGCQKCICESPCEKEPKCPSHCKIETNAPEGRCRGCVCSVGEQAETEEKTHENNESISKGTDTEPEKREDLEADFIPLPGKEIVPEVDKIFFVHGDGDNEKYSGLPGYHYSGGHAFPVFGEPLESDLYNTDDHISGDVEGGDYEHDEDGYVPDYAEEKTIEDDEDEKCAQKNCPEGQKCVIRRLQCIRTPCPTIPVCIDVEPRCPIPMCAIGCMVMKWDDEVCPSCFCGIIRGAEGRVCPRTRCVGRRCYNVIGDDGCPQCKCDSICIAPTCTEGCSLDKDPPEGKCPTCICSSKSTVEPSIIRGTSPAITTTEPGTDYDNVEALSRDPEDYETGDENHSEHTDEYLSDDGTTMITEENFSSDEVATGADSLSKTEESTEDNLKLSLGHLPTDLYESLAEIEEQVKMSDPTTITINLPETSDYSDLIETSTQSTTISIDLPSDELLTTPKPCMLKPTISDTGIEENPVVNAFDDVKPIEKKTTSKPPTVTQKQTRPTQVTSTRKPHRKPTPIRRKNSPRPPTRKPIYSIETTPSDLPKEKVTSSSITSETTEANRPVVLEGRPSTNQHLKQKPVLKPHLTSENSESLNVKDSESNREESEGSMKPILQNLQQLMSNLHTVLSNHQRPAQVTELAPQVPEKKEPADYTKIKNPSNVTKDQVPDTSESEIKQASDSLSTNSSIQNDNKDALDLKTTTQDEISKDSSKIKPSSESLSDKLNETSENTKAKPDFSFNNPLALHGALLQHLIANPSLQNILASHHLLSNPAFVSPLLQQGVNPQYHLYPHYAYQSNPGGIQLVHPSQIPNIPYQTSYYPQTQGQGFLSNLPLQHDQYSQMTPQFQQQQFLSTNLPMPPSLQQQLQAGTQKIGFLTQFNNHNAARPPFVSEAAVSQSPETSQTSNVLDTKYPNPQEINKNTSTPEEVHIDAQSVEIQTMPPFPENDNTSNSSLMESILNSEETTGTSSETDQTVIQQFNHHAPPSKQQVEIPVPVQTSSQSQSDSISTSNDVLEEIPTNQHQNDHSHSDLATSLHDDSVTIEKIPDYQEAKLPHLQDLERLNYQSQQQQVLIQQLQAQQSQQQNQLQKIQSTQEQYFYDKNKDKTQESEIQTLNDQAQLEISTGDVSQSAHVSIPQNDDKNLHVTAHFRPENIQNSQAHIQTQAQDPHFVSENPSVDQETDISQQNQQLIQFSQNDVHVQNTIQQSVMQNKPYLLQEQTQYLNQDINKTPAPQQAVQNSDELIAQQHQIQQQYQTPHVVLLKPDSPDSQVSENMQSQYYLQNQSPNIQSQDSQQGVPPLDFAQVRKQTPAQSEQPQIISNHNIPYNQHESSQQFLQSEQPLITQNQVYQHQNNFSGASLQQDANTYNSYAIINNQNQVPMHQQEASYQNKPVQDQQQSQYNTYPQDRPLSHQQQFTSMQDKYVLGGSVGMQYGPAIQRPQYGSQNNHQPQEMQPNYIQPATQNFNFQHKPIPAIQLQNQQIPHENKYAPQSFQQQASQEQHNQFWAHRPSETSNQVNPPSPSVQQTYTPPSEPVQNHPNYGYQQQLPTSSENILQNQPNVPQILNIHSSSVSQQQSTYQNTFNYQTSKEQIPPQVSVASEPLSSQHLLEHTQYIQQQVKPQVPSEYQQIQQEQEIKPLKDQHISDYSHQYGIAEQQLSNANERPQQQIQMEIASFNPSVSQQNYEQQTSFKPSEDIQEELLFSDEDGLKLPQQQEEALDTKPYEQQLQHSEIGLSQDFQQDSEEDRYSALKPIAQIITADSQYSKDDVVQNKDTISDNVFSEASVEQSADENQYTQKDSSFDQFLVQESVPPFEETTPKVHYGVKGRPGSVVRPHFHPVSSKPTTTTTTTTTESTYDLFPAPSRPLNQKPDAQQEEDYAHQQFMEEDVPQELSSFDEDEYDFDDNTLPTTATLTTQPPLAITTTKLFSPLHLSTAYPTTVKPSTPDESSQQHEIIESFDNHQPDFGKKPIDIQESIEEYDTTTPKKTLFAQPSTLKDPNPFASFPTASPTADTYGTAQHTSKSPGNAFSSYHCPTPHCNGYNCSLLRGPDGCQKCVCDSPCAPCPQYCVKTKVLSEGRCPICDCTVAHASGQQVPVKQCPNVDCAKPNCRKVKDNDGCFTCLCDPKCAEPKCDPGCEVLRNVPPGQCPGCVCRVTVVQAVVNKQKQCPAISCTGQNCRETKGPDGCPKCICDVSCPPPKCDPGCEVQTDVAQGQCPTCVCPTFPDEDDDEDDDLYCPNLFCADYGCREIPGPAGCPICMCDPVCKTPVCEPGCEVVTNKYLGRCPVCICSAPLGRTLSFLPLAKKKKKIFQFCLLISIELFHRLINCMKCKYFLIQNIIFTEPSVSSMAAPSPTNITYQAIESIKLPPPEVAQQPFSVEPVVADEEDSTASTLHTTVTVHFSPTETEEEEEEYEDETTEPTTTTEEPVATCPAPVCSGLRCNFEVGDDGCEVCKCRYKCPQPKCVGNCYPETNYPSHRCPGCVCPQKRPSKP
ncbi:uncharacterized protein LOC129226741 [Uloborus diversus]|uniref:uncharacterized protein LOC129226741 n=1 Tax=Uloborus diversus TaxID=327109 RepID=UPI00240911F5|nr:uncharacterized protein LOC129226741 [Uloborus diversus]